MQGALRPGDEVSWHLRAAHWTLLFRHQFVPSQCSTGKSVKCNREFAGSWIAAAAEEGVERRGQQADRTVCAAG